MAEFKIGDVVQLKSGGPKMTISEIEDNTYFCKWFEKEKVHTGRFSKEELKRYEQQSPSW